MAVCKQCGTENSNNAKFCQECAAPMVKEEPVIPGLCMHCGMQNNENAKFCQECAAPLREAAPKPKKVKKPREKLGPKLKKWWGARKKWQKRCIKLACAVLLVVGFALLWFGPMCGPLIYYDFSEGNLVLRDGCVDIYDGWVYTYGSDVNTYGGWAYTQGGTVYTQGGTVHTQGGTVNTHDYSTVQTCSGCWWCGW